MLHEYTLAYQTSSWGGLLQINAGDVTLKKIILGARDVELFIILPTQDCWRRVYNTPACHRHHPNVTQNFHQKSHPRTLVSWTTPKHTVLRYFTVWLVIFWVADDTCCSTPSHAFLTNHFEMLTFLFSHDSVHELAYFWYQWSFVNVS